MQKNLNIKNYSGEYYIGLDIGTTSVGWAAVDENMNILKYNKKLTWGSRLFDEAETAAARRTKRSMRRRYVRRRVRIGILNELMAPFVNDEAFFQRLQESFYKIDDRSQRNKHILFDDEQIEKKFYKCYPTMYHLRDALVNTTNAKADPRVIYLAIHHILKYRGNFLYENLNAVENGNLEDKWENLVTAFEEFGYEFEFDHTPKQIVDILSDHNITSSQKVKALKTGNNAELIKLILGQKANLDKIFDGNEFGDDGKFSLNDEGIEEKIAKLTGFEEILHQCLSFYNAIQYKKIMKDKSSVSEVMIGRYQKYKDELAQLRRILKVNLTQQEYNDYFRNLKIEDNYARYTEHGGNCGYEAFRTKLKKILEGVRKNLEAQDDIETIKEIDDIMLKINEGDFLRKPRNNENGVFPMQVHRNELVKIIDNQSKYYPYLAQIKDKILQLFDFRIDYFVGPLSNKMGKFAWIKKNPGFENTTITPLNYNEAVDFEASREEFITRMTRDCTYLWGEPALPRNSIYYTAFSLLNELNNIKYIDSNGEKPLPESVRERIFARFMETNTVKKRDIIAFFKQELGLELDESALRMSDSVKLNNNLKSYKDFMGILGKVDYTNIKMIEDCIESITILGESKKALEEKITKKYGDILTKEQIVRIRNLNYSGWGRLSKKLICDLKVQVRGEYKSILELMQMPFKDNWYHNFNHFYSKFGFEQQVEDENAKATKDTPKEMIDKLAGSPAIKRGIYQAYKIVNEIIKLFKRPPAQIFIEFAREEGKKQRTVSRRAELEDKYKAIEKSYGDLVAHIDRNALDVLKSKDSEALFSKERFVLYYQQLGRCAYSGEPLSLNDLSTYDVDHIIPRSLIKDDSFNNKVLVKKERNMRKLNDDVVPADVRNRMKSFWAMLRKLELITAEKYNRLTREYLSDKDKERFINRQLVETRQIVKNTADVLGYLFKEKGWNVEIKPVRANLNSQFREKFGYFKGDGGRAINDFHHAKDAYISVFLGKYLESNENLKLLSATYGTQRSKTKQYHSYGFVLDSLENENAFWGDSRLTNGDALNNFDRNYYYTNILYTKMTITKKDGSMYKETIYKNKKNTEKFGTGNKTLITLGKGLDKSKYLSTDDYGGYSDEEFACFAIVKYGDKKVKYKFVQIPVRYMMLGNNKILSNYIATQIEDSFEILKIVPKQQLFKTDGILFRVTGLSDRNAAKQLVFGRKDKELYEFIYHVYTNFARYSEQDKNENKVAYFDRNYKLFKEIFLNHIENNYPDFTKNIYEKLVNSLAKDEETDYDQKMKNIKEMLKITQCNSKRSETPEFKVVIQFTIKFENTYLIYQSPTGLRQKTVKITDL